MTAPDARYAPGGDVRRWIYTDGVHLVVDGDRPIEVLHEFAARLGFKRSWFREAGDGGPGHYVCTTTGAAERAVGMGAALIDMRDVARAALPTGHPRRPAGFEPGVLGRGAPACALARQKHGDVLEFLQGPGLRIWQATRGTARRRADAEAAVAAGPRIVRL